MAGFFTSFFCLRQTYCQADVRLGYCRRGGWTGKLFKAEFRAAKDPQVNAGLNEAVVKLMV